MSADTTPSTKADAYQEVKESGEDVSLRKRVAAALAAHPQTTFELTQEFDESANAIRPRVDELVRMGCVERTGKRENPSGHEAYVHELTYRGEMFLEGRIDPEPAPTLSELQGKIVETARDFVQGGSSEEDLAWAIIEHDEARKEREPGWEP